MAGSKPVLAIRGISDIIGFNREHEWINYACNSAASFTVALLRFRPIVPLSVKNSSRDGAPEAHTPLLVQNQQVGVFRKLPPNLTPVQRKENLFSNLLEVSYFPDHLYSVETTCKKREEVWYLLRDKLKYPPNDWVYTGKTLYAFHDFSDPIWKDVCDVGNVEPQPTSHWSESTDQDRISEFIDLLKGCLREHAKMRDLYYSHKPKVNGEKKNFKYLYFAPTSRFSTSPLFEPDDFIDAPVLINSLKERQTPLAKLLFASLIDGTQARVDACPSTWDKTLLTAIANAFNDLLRTAFYDPDIFAGINLRSRTRKLLAKDSTEEPDLIELNRALLEDAYWNEIAKRYLVSRTIVRQSVIRSLPRTVFKAYFAGNTRRLLYYRHHAFRYQFMRFEGQWYLEITPTYHYTSDGHRVLGYYEDLLRGIKKEESNEAVFRQVMFWSKVLHEDQTEFLERRKYPFLQFGKLLEFPFDYGVRDELWTKKESVPKADKDSSRRGRRTQGKTPDRPQTSTGTLFTQ